MSTIREIARDYLTQAINLQSPVIKIEDLFLDISINVILAYQGENNKEANKDVVAQAILDEYELLLNSPKIERFFEFQRLLKIQESLKHFSEVEQFVSEVKEEKILYHMLEIAIDRQDLKTIALLVPKLEIGYVHMLPAMKNKAVFEYLYKHYDKDPANLLSLACSLNYTKIQEFLMERSIEPRKIDFYNPKHQYMIDYLKAKEIRLALMSRIHLFHQLSVVDTAI